MTNELSKVVLDFNMADIGHNLFEKRPWDSAGRLQSKNKNHVVEKFVQHMSSSYSILQDLLEDGDIDGDLDYLQNDISKKKKRTSNSWQFITLIIAIFMLCLGFVGI